MNRRAIGWMVSAVASMWLIGGCGQPKQDALALEDQNQKLKNQFNQCRADLTSAMKERDAFNERLQTALKEAETLRGELAGRPEPAPEGWTAVPGGGMISLEEDILFNPGKATLRDEARKTLDKIVSVIEGEYASKDIMVFGHTDDRPIKKSGWDDNWQLSTERSLAVVRYLKDHEVGAGRLVAAGCGEFRPRVANNSEPNRFKNRRVEIFAIAAQPRTGRPK